MKKTILFIALAIAIAAPSASKAQAPALGGWGWTTGDTFLVFIGRIDTPSLLPVNIVVTVFQTDSLGSDSTTGFWTSGVFHQDNYFNFEDTVFGLPPNSFFKMNVAISNDSGLIAETLYGYTSYPAGIVSEQPASARNIWNPMGTKVIRYANAPENSTMVITNIIGQLISSSVIVETGGQVDIRKLQPGMYIVSLLNEKKVVQTSQKILIE